MIFSKRSAHEFHIPVMGTGFTAGTPVDVARYGISSVISLVDDLLLEQLRHFYCTKFNRPFDAIPHKDPDARALRIRAYLDLVNELVQEQSKALRNQPFIPGSDITRYFELLPEGALKDQYRLMCRETDPLKKEQLENNLRDEAVPGSIDVNIMTKLDRLPYVEGQPAEPEFSEAISALRGFATSQLNASIVFSAGLNAPLYSALAGYPDFIPDASGHTRKTVTLKVSDYRSALIQGKFLAKRGIWVSEFRVESGLNCGGHAFATQGNLIGPILEEFCRNRKDMQERLHKDYNKGLAALSRPPLDQAREMLITVQGGIGTHAEHRALMQYYKVGRTGWATPFLLVPEATSVDEEHLKRLIEAGEGDITLGDSSPMGIPFWTLKTSESEVQRCARIENGNSGSPCPKGHLRIFDDFEGEPLCKASNTYQRLKLQEIDASGMTEPEKKRSRESLLAKACICHDLGGGATLKHGIVKSAYTAICPGLSIVHFKELASLEEMVGHIYGRLSLLKDSKRPHMFIRELSLYVEYLHKELERFAAGICERKLSYFAEFKKNLLEGISYYQERFMGFVSEHQERFQTDLILLKTRVEKIQTDSFS